VTERIILRRRCGGIRGRGKVRPWESGPDKYRSDPLLCCVIATSVLLFNHLRWWVAYRDLPPSCPLQRYPWPFSGLWALLSPIRAPSRVARQWVLVPCTLTLSSTPILSLLRRLLSSPQTPMMSLGALLRIPSRTNTLKRTILFCARTLTPTRPPALPMSSSARW